MSPEYGVDLVTFYHPGFWGVASAQEMQRWCAAHPRQMWERILEVLPGAGVAAIETTFAPLDFRSAIAAFGSAGAARDALAERGLRILSGFHNAVHWADLDAAAALAEVREYAAFLQECGATVMVVGTPMLHEQPLDARERDGLLTHLAGLLDRVGAELAGHGLRPAVHTEAHSITVEPQDLRTLMERTDPDLVGLCPDSAHLVLTGADPVAVAREHAGRVLVSHWKDAVGPFTGEIAPGGDIHAAHRTFMRRLGQGSVDWAGWAAVMADTPTAGVRLLELDAAADPVTELHRAQEVLAALPASTQ